MELASFLEKFRDAFPGYVEHVVLSWYLRNAKSEAFALATMPTHMASLVADFAQNIQVVKRWEVAEEYFHRPEIALHGILSGMRSACDGKHHQTSHITTCDYRYHC